MTDTANPRPPASARDDDLARHASKMAKVKAARDRMMATKQGEKGLVIIRSFILTRLGLRGTRGE